MTGNSRHSHMHTPLFCTYSDDSIPVGHKLLTRLGTETFNLQLILDKVSSAVYEIQHMEIQCGTYHIFFYNDT